MKRGFTDDEAPVKIFYELCSAAAANGSGIPWSTLPSCSVSAKIFKSTTSSRRMLWFLPVVAFVFRRQLRRSFTPQLVKWLRFKQYQRTFRPE